MSATADPQLKRASGASARGATPRRSARELFRATVRRFRWAIIAYLATRALVLAVAIVNGALRHHAVLHELANWDGLLYRQLANNGYPSYVPHVRSTLGFFPLFPLLMWPLGHAIAWATSQSVVTSLTISGLVISGIGGLIMAMLVQQLATDWWGEAAGRRAAVLFCLFPGSVVFSMVYAEGIALPLAAGCILALQRKRWLLAGALAGLATATEPEAVVLVLVCAVSALLELRRRGVAARSSLLAPLLSVTGIGAFGVYLWAHAGTPFAYTKAQHYGWNERFDPFALVHMTHSLANEISFSHFNHPTIDLNLVVGVAGTIVLIALLVLLFRIWRTVSVEALVWTLGISFLTVTSEFVPPNPRLLITAFPAVMALAYYARGKAFACLALANGVLLAGLSALTFVGVTLRP
jgi:Mannosyltransferase (PIG-V)